MYKNANTPSSKVRFPARVINKNKAEQKEGHEGKTRRTGNPTIRLDILTHKSFSETFVGEYT